MTHVDKTCVWLRDPGVEIGAFKSPIPGIKPFYVDKYREFGYERCLADYFGEAVRLPFRSNSLNYIASSHVLEHVANPVKALMEWYRVLRPGGIIYLVVPDRRYTWDRFRTVTPVEHMLEDFNQGTTPADPTHIEDFVRNVDWSGYSPQTPIDKVEVEKDRLVHIYNAAVAAGEEINIHFHVFEPSNVVELIQRLKSSPSFGLDWTLVDQCEKFPDDNPIGFLAVIRVNKSVRDRFSATGERLRRLLKGRSASMTADATKFG